MLDGLFTSPTPDSRVAADPRRRLPGRRCRLGDARLDTVGPGPRRRRLPASPPRPQQPAREESSGRQRATPRRSHRGSRDLMQSREESRPVFTARYQATPVTAFVSVTPASQSVLTPRPVRGAERRRLHAQVRRSPRPGQCRLAGSVTRAPVSALATLRSGQAVSIDSRNSSVPPGSDQRRVEDSVTCCWQSRMRPCPTKTPVTRTLGVIPSCPVSA
jgi:hypothetical protein